MNDAPGQSDAQLPDDYQEVSHPADGTYHAVPIGEPRRRPPIILWIVFVMLVAGIVALQAIGGRQAMSSSQQASGPSNPATVSSPFVKMVSKLCVGIDAASGSRPSAANDKERQQVLAELDSSAITPIDKLRAVAGAVWADGKDAALDRLRDAEAHGALNSGKVDADFPNDVALFRRTLEEGSSSLSADERDTLIKRHGWFADALFAYDAPKNDPSRTALLASAVVSLSFLIGAIGIIIVALLLGVVVLVVLCSRVLNRTLVICHPYDLRASAPTGSTLLEMVCVFLAGFVLVQVIASAIAMVLKIDVTSIIVWLLLAVVVWPLSRNVPWSRLKFALGWHKGRGVLREMGAGILGYLAGLPIVAASFGVTLILMGITKSQPSHPVVENLAKQTPLEIITMYVLASLWAPIVEETIFRGALFHHLRRGIPSILAAMCVGFVFAIIHPQGIVLVPPLMTLGAVFCMIREWRGSLIGPMTAHAMHNAFLVTMLTVLLA